MTRASGGNPHESHFESSLLVGQQRPPGELPFPRIFFALGYGGNGITFSLIATEIIRDCFLGRKNRDAPTFASAAEGAFSAA